MKILQSPSFSKTVKKMHKQEKLILTPLKNKQQVLKLKILRR
jgi:hypothetical protein